MRYLVLLNVQNYPFVRQVMPGIAAVECNLKSLR